MGTKLRKQQLKKEWTENGTHFPEAYAEKVQLFLKDVEGNTVAQDFGLELAQLLSLRSTFAEQAALKILMGKLKAFALLLDCNNADGSSSFMDACLLMSSMLFLPKSQPIHRQLLSGLLQVDGNQQQEAVMNSLKQQVISNASDLDSMVNEGRFDFADSISSLLAMPRLQDVTRFTAAPALSGLAQGLLCIVAIPSTGSSKHISPCLADQAQEAISCMYSLISRCPESLLGDSGCHAILAAAGALQAAITGTVLPRETRAAGAVAFSAALQMPHVHPAVTALHVAKACCPNQNFQQPGVMPERMGFLQKARRGKQGSVLDSLMADTEQIAQICLLRGLVSGLPTAVWLMGCCPWHVAWQRRPQMFTPSFMLKCSSAAVFSRCWSVGRLAVRAAGWTDHGRMQQDALLLKDLSSSSSTMQESLLDAQHPPQQPSMHLDLDNFSLHSQQQGSLMRLMWAHWEDPLPQTVKQVHTAFGLLLDLNADCGLPATPNAAPSSRSWELHESLALKLLQLRGHRKGKYGPLAGLVPRMGAQALLELEPNLVTSCMEAMQQDAVCKSASSLLAALLSNLWLQLHALHPGNDEVAIAAWEEAWIPPMLQLLAVADDRMRSHLSIYAMPVPLGKCPASILQLLVQLLHPATSELLAAQVPSVIAVLKTARQLQLMDGLSQVTVPGHEPLGLPHTLLEQAVIHSSESLRIDVMQLACLHPRSTAFPGVAELRIVAQSVSLNMRGEGAGLRSKWLTLLNQLLHRINVASHAALHRQAMRTTSRHPPDGAAADERGLSEQQSFLDWLSRLILASLYPGAASQRKVTALMILNLIQQEWFPTCCQESGMATAASKAPGQSIASRPSTSERPSSAAGQVFEPFCQGFMGAAMVQSLLGCLIDGWTRLRDACGTALLQMPTPLPAYEGAAAMQALLSSAVGLLQSPRVRESDAGSRLLAIIFQKHVVQQGWSLNCAECSRPSVAICSADGDRPAPVMVFIESLLHLLQEGLRAGEEDLLTACKSSLAHGPLLTLRYVMPHLPWHLSSLKHMLQVWLSRLLESLERAMHMTLPPLARPQEANMGADDVDVMGDEDNDDFDMDGDLGPETQIITTGCWLTMKEAILVIGKVADHAPSSGLKEDQLLNSEQTLHIGTLLLNMLLQMKHNGAVDIAHEGLCSLVKRVLKDADASLSILPSQWLDQLLARVCEPGQSRDDIIRRSAGLPPAFMSIFLAEPQGTHKHLLHAGLSGLLVIAGKQEEREPWPCVHSLNCLRMAFNHTDLALDSSGFFAQGMQVAIVGMDASAWEIRNSASLMYAALIMRMLGFRNLQKGELPRRAVTAADFFHRYPSLHSFLLQRLQRATQQLPAGFTGQQPSLFPILALLGRLRPSAAARKSDRDQHPLSPEAFVPLALLCGKAQPMAVRSLAAQSLAAVAPLGDSALVDHLLSQLPAAKEPISSQNLAHGTLLQLQQLVMAASQFLETTPDWLQLLPARLQSSASHLLSPCACPAVRSAFLGLFKSLQAALPDPARQQNSGLEAQDGTHAGISSKTNADSADDSYTAVTPAAIAALQKAVQYAANAALQSTPGILAVWPGIHGDARSGKAAPATDQSSMANALQLPYQAVWLKQATKTLLSGQGNSREQAALSPQLLQHPVSEVRAAAAKALVTRALQGPPQELPSTQELAFSHILQEQNLKVLRRLLFLANLVPTSRRAHHSSNAHCLLASATACDADSHPVQRQMSESQPFSLDSRARCSSALVQRLLILAQSHDPDVRQGALCCLGKIVSWATHCTPLPVDVMPELDLPHRGEQQTNHQIQQQPMTVAAAQLGPADTIPCFLALVAEAVKPWQPWQVRAAAARALQHSGLLKLKAASTALGDDQQAWTLAAWWATISLMEDEDEDVQSATASAAASAILGDGSASGAHVDWVQRRSFAFLFDDVGESPQHLQHLLDWIYRQLCHDACSSSSKVEQLIIWLGGIAKDLGSLVDRLQEQSGLEHTSAVLQVGTFRTAVFEQLTRALLGVQVAQAAFTDELRDAISMSVQQLKQLPLHPVLESLLDGAWSRLASAQDTALLKQGLGISVHELGHSRQPGLVLGSLTESF
ncbi:hypothetical protein WJX74_007694 [Apatococcus lobatus]|uniref:DUF2428 domain-containing protein n=1 Tax=Apatococcus lobatus TaxID=904363 RepID=A0AAW1RAR9_9CHLO